jgi:hypothetical protein
VLRNEATNTNFIIFRLTSFTTLETSTLTITPPMWFKILSNVLLMVHIYHHEYIFASIMFQVKRKINNPLKAKKKKKKMRGTIFSKKNSQYFFWLIMYVFSLSIIISWVDVSALINKYHVSFFDFSQFCALFVYTSFCQLKYFTAWLLSCI